jgi:hypothetical protein
LVAVWVYLLEPRATKTWALGFAFLAITGAVRAQEFPEWEAFWGFS